MTADNKQPDPATPNRSSVADTWPPRLITQWLRSETTICDDLVAELRYWCIKMAGGDPDDYSVSLPHNGWWIATDFAANGGEKVLGPFHSRDLALRVRNFVEQNHARTYAVDDRFGHRG